MRKFYPSRTLRNFSMYHILPMTRAECTTLEAVLPIVDARLREGTRKESLDRMVQATNALVRNPFLRYTPLILKRAVFRISYQLFGERAVTTTLSNLGVITGGLGDAVDMFDFVLGPSGTNNANCALVTYQDKAVFSITRSTCDAGFENTIYRELTRMGIEVTAEEATL